MSANPTTFDASRWILFQSVHDNERGRPWSILHLRSEPVGFWVECVGEQGGKKVWRWWLRVAFGDVEVSQGTWEEVRKEMAGMTLGTHESNLAST